MRCCQEGIIALSLTTGRVFERTARQCSSTVALQSALNMKIVVLTVGWKHVILLTVGRSSLSEWDCLLWIHWVFWRAESFVTTNMSRDSRYLGQVHDRWDTYGYMMMIRDDIWQLGLASRWISQSVGACGWLRWRVSTAAAAWLIKKSVTLTVANKTKTRKQKPIQALCCCFLFSIVFFLGGGMVRFFFLCVDAERWRQTFFEWRWGNLTKNRTGVVCNLKGENLKVDAHWIWSKLIKQLMSKQHWKTKTWQQRSTFDLKNKQLRKQTHGWSIHLRTKSVGISDLGRSDGCLLDGHTVKLAGGSKFWRFCWT